MLTFPSIVDPGKMLDLVYIYRQIHGQNRVVWEHIRTSAILSCQPGVPVPERHFRQRVQHDTAVMP